MPTPHIESVYGEINNNVLMPGDPKRAKYIADKYLTDVKIINNVRNMTAYSGKYKGKDITIFPSGMGIPSMGIYSYELFKFYNVQNIIRVGTCGANREDVKILDIILANSSYSLSSFIEVFDNCKDKEISSSNILNEKIESTSKDLNINIKKGRIITSDVFNPYCDNIDEYNKKYPEDLDTLASEMESFALFYMAKKFNRNATCLLTVVDSQFDDRIITSEEREKSLDDMIILALEACLK